MSATQELLRLYLVADPEQCAANLVETVKEAIHGGVTCVQLRAKNLPDRDHLALAKRLRVTCQDRSVSLIVNDRFDIALLSNADGIHLGVDDLPVESVRSRSPEGFIIGFSPETDEQIRDAGNSGVDYLGIGPVFGTQTKHDAGSALGLDEFRRRCSLTPLPVVGIGGISAMNAHEVLDAGANGVAVVSAILSSDRPAMAARALRG
jgi:thiamine-phosphate pyrophosphorylase